MQHPAIAQEAISGPGGSAATGGNSYTFHNGLSKDSQTLVVVLSSFSLAVAICVLVVYLTGRASDRDRINDKIAAAETRAMDRATLAEREARIAQDKIDTLTTELGKQKIFVRTDGH